MTIKEIREKYGHYPDGYVTCSNCPVPESECAGHDMQGYQDCWERIEKYLSEHPDCPLVKIDDLLKDINPTEIAAQIVAGHLDQWCETIRKEIRKRLEAD